MKKTKHIVFSVLLAALSISLIALPLPVAFQHSGGGVAGSKVMTKVPTLGGGINAGTDWADAWPSSAGQTNTVCLIGACGTTFDLKVWTKNDARNLYIAIRVPDTTNSGGSDGLSIFLDENHNGVIDPISAGGLGGEDVKTVYGNAAASLVDFTYYTTSGLDYDSSVDGAVGGQFTGTTWEWEFRIPLNSPDSLDLNVNSGVILGVMVQVLRDSDVFQGPTNSGVNSAYDPSMWADLATVRVYEAVVPRVANSVSVDGLSYGLGFVLVKNDGSQTATIVLRRLGGAGVLGAVSSVSLNAGAQYRFTPASGNSVQLVVYGTQPFTLQLYQAIGGTATQTIITATNPSS